MPDHINKTIYDFMRDAAGRLILLASSGVLVPNTIVDVRGCRMYTVSVEGIASDVFALEARLTGGAWYSKQSMNANQFYEVTGIFDEMRLTKTSGSGTTAKIILRYGR